MNVAIEIPDELGRLLALRSGGISRSVLEAVAAEAYRSGAITPAQVQQMLDLGSRWETNRFCAASTRIMITPRTTLRRISPQFAMLPPDDRGNGHYASRD